MAHSCLLFVHANVAEIRTEDGTLDRRRNIPYPEEYAFLFPETLGSWNYYNDPLIDGEEPTPRFEAWDVEDHDSTVH